MLSNLQHSQFMPSAKHPDRFIHDSPSTHHYHFFNIYIQLAARNFFAFFPWILRGREKERLRHSTMRATHIWKEHFMYVALRFLFFLSPGLNPSLQQMMWSLHRYIRERCAAKSVHWAHIAWRTLRTPLTQIDTYYWILMATKWYEICEGMICERVRVSLTFSARSHQFTFAMVMNAKTCSMSIAHVTIQNGFDLPSAR